MKTRIHGASLIELVAGLLIAIPVFLAVFNLATLTIGAQLNEKVCLQAVRLAASGDPSTAEQRVLVIIAKANEEKTGMVQEIRLVSVTNSVNTNNMQTLRTNGGTVAGTVTVVTAIDLKPSFAQWLPAGHQFFTFQSQQSFPYTYIIPSKTNSGN